MILGLGAAYQHHRDDDDKRDAKLAEITRLLERRDEQILQLQKNFVSEFPAYTLSIEWVGTK